ncbi:MAG TPA: histidine kinase [Chitinophagaceae bacterium]|nr:histidine kinase [Chitinophagaceae bacterium]
MRKLIVIAFWCFAAQVSYAQQNIVDSLKKVIASTPANDTNKVLLLMNLARATVYSNPDSMLAYADEALKISKEIRWKRGIARSLQLKGVAYSYGMNDQISALAYYHKALDANNNPKDAVLEFNTIANIAIIFYNMKQLDESLQYYKQAMALLNKMKNKPGEEQLYLNIGNVYYDKHIADSADYYFSKSLALAEQKGNTMIRIGALNALGTSFIDAGKYADAKNYVVKSLMLSEQTGNILTKAVSLVNMALIQFYTHRLDSAEIYANTALAAATEAGSLQFRRQAYSVLSMTEEKLGKYKEALLAAKNFNALNDSLLSDESKQQVTRLEMQYNFDKKQALDAAEINRQKVIRNATIVIASILVLVSLGGIIVYKRRKDILQEKKEAEFNAQVADTEMKALRAQMNPHFIYNSLNSINDYIDKHDTATATLYTTKFAKLMRTILENSERKEVPLADDLRALELYMQLENMRLQNKFRYEIKVEDAIDAENTLIPPLILQPFVENSIWHGFSRNEEDAKIFIYIKKQGNMINCSVEDNGKGIAPDTVTYSQAQKKSLGMKITRARIDIINSIKKSNAAINIFPLEKGTRVEVTFPEALAF